jgi:hypothetical protein
VIPRSCHSPLAAVGQIAQKMSDQVGTDTIQIKCDGQRWLLPHNAQNNLMLIMVINYNLLNFIQKKELGRLATELSS